MSYDYEKMRPQLFTDEGQRMFLRVRDRARELTKTAGAARVREILSGAGISGDSWLLLACIDRMVELGELLEVGTDPCAQQMRIFMGRAA